MNETYDAMSIEILKRAREDFIRNSDIKTSKEKLMFLDDFICKSFEMGLLDKYEEELKKEGEKFDFKITKENDETTVYYNKNRWSEESALEHAQMFFDEDAVLVSIYGVAQFGNIIDNEFISEEILYKSLSLDEIEVTRPVLIPVWGIKQKRRAVAKFSEGERVKISIPFDVTYHNKMGTVRSVLQLDELNFSYIIDFYEYIAPQVFKEERLTKVE